MSNSIYFPPGDGTWETIVPEKAGLDPAAIKAAKTFALDHESTMDRDIGRALATGHFSEPMPDGEIIGPTRPRGDPSGLILKRGRIVAEWGPTDAPDMTFSVTKSYLSICAGLAVDDGLIPDIDAPCRLLVDDLFDHPQNRTITWRHLLHQTSEWEGTLWGKADRIDRNRKLDVPPNTPSLKGTHRDLQAPGAFWEYNDIRVNVLSTALMRVFRRSLPDVLRERIMQPIGASDTWTWNGYRNSTLVVDGESLQAVSGGAHWGGGLFISARDHARVGLMMLNEGTWNGQQLIGRDWIRASTTPCPLNPDYGFLWWLNGRGAQSPSASPESYFALGVGRNAIWIDPKNDLVVVLRWIERDALDGFTEALAVDCVPAAAGA
ncbi:MAG: serine hydrolase [Pseudomonadota bacterium]